MRQLRPSRLNPAPVRFKPRRANEGLEPAAGGHEQAGEPTPIADPNPRRRRRVPSRDEYLGRHRVLLTTCVRVKSYPFKPQPDLGGPPLSKSSPFVGAAEACGTKEPPTVQRRDAPALSRLSTTAAMLGRCLSSPKSKPFAAASNPC